MNRLISKYHCLFILLLIVILSMKETQSYAQQEQEYYKSPVNWGVKVGLNALSTTVYEIYYNDIEVPNGSYTNKNGYMVSAFLRINLDHFFMQPEASWNYYRQECSFTKPIEGTENSYYPATSLKINSSSANINILAGYHIVKNGPYIFNFYAGASVKSVYQTDFTTRTDYHYTSKDMQYNITGILGFSMNIAKLHFDVRYELSQSDTNLELSKIPDFPEDYHGLLIKKNENILSFSCGVMF